MEQRCIIWYNTIYYSGRDDDNVTRHVTSGDSGQVTSRVTIVIQFATNGCSGGGDDDCNDGVGFNVDGGKKK